MRDNKTLRKGLIASGILFVIPFFVLLALPAQAGALETPATPAPVEQLPTTSSTSIATPVVTSPTVLETSPTKPTNIAKPTQSVSTPNDQPVAVPAAALPVPADDPITPPAPGTPVATSPSNSGNIVWEWTPPAGYPLPEPLPNTGGEEVLAPLPTDIPEEIPANETPTDIWKYGYELLNDNTIVQQGEVNGHTLKLVTSVTKDGVYIFRVWAITYENAMSDKAEGQTTIQVQPPIESNPPVVDTPYPTTPLYVNTANVVVADPITLPAMSYYTPKSDTTQTFASDIPEFPREKAATSSSDNGSDTPATITPAVLPSTQGWQIFGIAWYIWALALVILLTAWRWIVQNIKGRS